MALEGTLHEFDISNIFQIISQESKTGKLYLTAPDREGCVIFRHGLIVHAETDRQKPLVMLCKYLDYIKKYSKSEIAELRAIFHDNLRSFARELLEKHYLEESELFEIIETTITDISCNIFTWKEGNYRFETLPNADRFQVGDFSVSVNSVGMEGARQADELERIRAHFNGDSVFFVDKKHHIPQVPAMVLLDDFPTYLLTRIDGTSTVTYLCTEAFYSEFQVYEALRTLIDKKLISALSSKFSSSVSEAIQRTADEAETSIISSVFATAATALLIATILFVGNILYRGTIFSRLFTRQTEVKTELLVSKGKRKVAEAQLQYRIERLNQPANLTDLIESGYLKRGDFPPQNRP